MAIINENELIEDVIETLMSHYGLTQEEALDAWEENKESIISAMYSAEGSELEWIAEQYNKNKD